MHVHVCVCVCVCVCLCVRDGMVHEVENRISDIEQ